MGQPALLEAVRLQLTELVLVPLTVPMTVADTHMGTSHIAERGSVNGRLMVLLMTQ